MDDPKRIAVYFTKTGFDSYPFDEQEYREGYRKLGALIAERGGEFSIVRGQRTYIKGNTFRGRWEFDKEKTLFFWRKGEYTFDVIFNKGRLIATPDAHILNNPELDRICIDKFRTYELFKDLSPLTLRVHDAGELERALMSISTNTIVAKPVDGEGGHGVFVGSREHIRSQVKTFPYLVQEFIDTSGGIPSIAPGKHDFRLVVVQGEIVAGFIRSPQEGKYVANVSQGGTIWEVKAESVPQSARAIIAKIDKEFSCFPKRIYSVDLGLDKGKHWKIIELNSQPGLSIADYNEGDGAKKMFKKIADLLVAP